MPISIFSQILLRLSLVCIGLGAASIQIIAQTYNFSALDRLLQDSVAKISGTGGGYTLILIKDGREIYNKTFTAPNRTYSADRPVPIASASKWLSAGVVMGMVDDGTWKLDDSAGQFLRYVTGDKARMTIRQLFSMTSGIREEGGSIEDEILRNPMISLDSAVRAILALPLATAPGGSMAYGGRGMHVAGRCAEIASKLPLQSGDAWDTLFARYVARPLGMRFTFFTNANNPGVAGSIVSSANEYKTYLQMLLNGGVWNGKRILSQRIINEMKLDQTNNAPILYSPYALLAPFVPGIDRTTRYALGHWREVTDAGSKEVLESSSQGAFGFSPWIDWGRNLIGVFSVQSQLLTIMPTYIQMKRLIRTALDATTNVQSGNDTSFRISPNPTHDILHIDGLEGTVSLRITNLLGQNVRILNDVQMPNWIDISSIPSGCYCLHVQTNNQIFHHIFHVVR